VATVGVVQIPESAQDLILSAPLGHLVTVNADGSPHLTIVWVDLDGGELIIGKLMADQKMANLARDPRVSISFEGEGAAHGMTHYLVVEGTARVEDGGAPELLQHLAGRYIGPGVKFPPMDNPPAGFTIRITPEKVRGMGPWSS
jgi:PPOX class probable F420-dependent enzyme